MEIMFSHKGTESRRSGWSGGSVPPGARRFVFWGGVWGWQALPLWLGALVRKSRCLESRLQAVSRTEQHRSVSGMKFFSHKGTEARRSGWSGGSVPPGARRFVFWGWGVGLASPSFVPWCLCEKIKVFGVPPSGGLPSGALPLGVRDEFFSLTKARRSGWSGGSVPPGARRFVF